MPEVEQVPPKPSSPKGILIVILLIVLLGGGTLAAVSLPKGQNNNAQNPQPTQGQGASAPLIASPIAPHTLVFGSWTGSGSLVNSLDLNSGKYTTLAVLPINIKKVSVLSSDQLLFIDQTNNQDHGKQLTGYSLKDKKSQFTVKAADGFGIDDYVVSPNKQYVATWEVAFANGSSILRGGKSRVYAVNLSNPTAKQLIYDEAANTPVHYPRAILNNGTLFLDTFLPNDTQGGAGWAYGMSMANATGSEKQDLPQMKNGTYATQPLLSPDGKKLVFAGYDGAFGPGTALKDGYRQALLTPNTIETLDVASLAREKLSNISSTNTYPSVAWDTATGNVLYTALSKDPNTTGTYLYDIGAHNAKKLATNNASVVTALSPDKLLVGTADDSPSALGNLGDSYAPSYTKLSVQNIGNPTTQPLNLPDPLMQFIALTPANYFPATSQAQATDQTSPAPSTAKEKDNLQLYTFFLKSNLAPIRSSQQSGDSTSEETKNGLPKCVNLAAQQCQAQGIQADSTEYETCVKETKKSLKSNDSACYDSPLYLYGKTGQNVKVTINTPVSSAVPAYHHHYDVTLAEDGQMLIGGQTYDRIAYDYTSALRRLTLPARGTVVPQGAIQETLTGYARHLGLNEKETTDLVKVGQKIQTPYVYISFFDHATSQAILPLSFVPQPDNYLNVVFYFKQLQSKPAITPVPPVFGKPLNRSGFTAVEVSEIIE